MTHVDALYWRSDWSPVPPEAFAERHKAVIVAAPRFVCLWRVVRRRLTAPRSTRPDLVASERLTLSFLRWIWGWDRRHPDFVGEIRSLVPNTPVLVARGRDAVEGLLHEAGASRRSRDP